MENRKDLKLIDKKYRDYLMGLMLDLDRVDVYAEVLSECINELGVTTFGEIKYRVSGDENINEVILNVLGRLPNSGHLNKLKGVVEYFDDIDWLDKYTKR